MFPPHTSIMYQTLLISSVFFMNTAKWSQFFCLNVPQIKTSSGQMSSRCDAASRDDRQSLYIIQLAINISQLKKYLILCICIINIIIRYACFVSLVSIIQRKRLTVTLTGASIIAVLRLTRWAPSLIQKSRRNTILNCLIDYLILDTNGTLKLTVIHLKTSNE